MGCAFRILGLQPISINLLCNFGQAEYLHYPPWASGSSSSSTVKWEQTIILTLQDTCKRQNEVLSQYTRALNKASTKCNYETRTDLFLPSTPSFLPYPSASLTSLISLCLVGFLSHYPQPSPHLTPPPLPPVPQQFSQEQFWGTHRKCTICTAFVLTTPCSPAPHLYLPEKLPELAGYMVFGKIILYFNLTMLFECCYCQLLTSRAYTDLLGFVVFTPFFLYFVLGGEWLHHTACGISTPQPGVEPKQSPNHWTAREGPSNLTSSIT